MTITRPMTYAGKVSAILNRAHFARVSAEDAARNALSDIAGHPKFPERAKFWMDQRDRLERFAALLDRAASL